MRRLAGILLTVATIATVVFTLTTAEAGASHRVVRPRVSAPGSTAADRRLCQSFDHLIRFLRHAPKPTALRSAEGRQVLAALQHGQPAQVGDRLRTMTSTFGRLRDGKPVTAAQNQAASDALLRVSVYAAGVCKQKLVKQFAAAMVSARVNRAEASTSTTAPAP
jgi:hypothetical protein